MFSTAYPTISVFSLGGHLLLTPNMERCLFYQSGSISLAGCCGLGVGLAAAATSVVLAGVDVRCFIGFQLLEADVDKVLFPGHSVHVI